MTRSFVATAGMALLLMWSDAALATQAKCLAGKTSCVAKAGAGLMKCEHLARTPGKPADPNADDCVDEVEAKFDGGPLPAKGCFEKLENKVPNDCLTLDDTAAAEAAIEHCVATLVAVIDPAPLTQTTCGVGKTKCVAKYLTSLLKCRAVAQTPGKPTDPNTKGCVDKATAKYLGGATPAKGCFAKLEAKTPNDCQFMNDAASLQFVVESCVGDLTALLASPTTTTSTTTTSSSTNTSSTTSTTLCFVDGGPAPTFQLLKAENTGGCCVFDPSIGVCQPVSSPVCCDNSTFAIVVGAGGAACSAECAANGGVANPTAPIPFTIVSGSCSSTTDTITACPKTNGTSACSPMLVDLASCASGPHNLTVDVAGAVTCVDGTVRSCTSTVGFTWTGCPVSSAAIPGTETGRTCGCTGPGCTPPR